MSYGDKELAAWNQKRTEARIRELETERDGLLGGLDCQEMDGLLDRWDQTEPEMQRKIMVGFAVMCKKLKAELDAAKAAVRGGIHGR